MVIREDIFGYDLGLVNDYLPYLPKPDYWIAFLYKKLVGNQVFNVTSNSNDSNLRLYAASSKR